MLIKLSNMAGFLRTEQVRFYDDLHERYLIINNEKLSQYKIIIIYIYIIPKNDDVL